VAEQLAMTVEHSEEIIEALFWALGGLAAVLFGLLRWIAGRIILKLTGIEDAILRTNETLNSIEKDLRDDLSSLDRRVARVEVQCATTHRGPV